MTTWETVLGIAVTVIVMPGITFIATIARRTNAIDNRLSVVETRQQHHENVMDRVEEHHAEFRAEVNKKLDLVIEHMLKGKK